MTNEHDPYVDAMKDNPAQGKFWGKITTDCTYWRIEKGEKKVPFDPQIHREQFRRVSIALTVEPLNPTHNFIQREMMEFDINYQDFVKKSILELAEDIAKAIDQPPGTFPLMRALSGLYVQGSFVEKKDNPPGKSYTTLYFEKVFKTEDECATDYEQVTGQPRPTGESPVEDLPFTPDEVAPKPEPQPKEEPKIDPERATFANFLPALWAQANGDIAKMEQLLNENPMLAKHFDINSDEVKAITGQ